MKITKNINAYFAIALALAFLGSWLAKNILGDTILAAMISSALTLGVIISWVAYFLRHRKTAKASHNAKTESHTEIDEEPSVAWEIVKTIIGVALFVVFFRFFIIQPFYIIGSSMLPGFHEGEYLFIDEASYHLRTPARGEVVVFRHPDEACTAFVKNNELLKTVVQGPCKSYIKRVIGLPGETVEIKGGKVTIFNDKNPNGLTLDEDYIQAGVQTLGNQKVTLTKDQFFVLGDNREPNASSDSREWGPLTKDYIIGRAWLRLLPVSEMGFIQTAKY
jgi:signal peptidase I